MHTRLGACGSQNFLDGAKACIFYLLNGPSVLMCRAHNADKLTAKPKEVNKGRTTKAWSHIPGSEMCPTFLQGARRQQASSKA